MDKKEYIECLKRCPTACNMDELRRIESEEVREMVAENLVHARMVQIAAEFISEGMLEEALEILDMAREELIKSLNNENTTNI
jgi:hypothetical protein